MAVQHTRWVVVVLSVLAVSGLALVATGASARPSTPDRSAAVERGRVTFEQSCAVCHGPRGKGNGQAASALTPRPTDLTVLTKGNVSFPAKHLEAVLKGQDAQAAHTSVMLVWRALFLADANGDESVANRRVADLISFIETIQVK